MNWKYSRSYPCSSDRENDLEVFSCPRSTDDEVELKVFPFSCSFDSEVELKEEEDVGKEVKTCAPLEAVTSNIKCDKNQLSSSKDFHMSHGDRDNYLEEQEKFLGRLGLCKTRDIGDILRQIDLVREACRRRTTRSMKKKLLQHT